MHHTNVIFNTIYHAIHPMTLHEHLPLKSDGYGAKRKFMFERGTEFTVIEKRFNFENDCLYFLVKVSGQLGWVEATHIPYVLGSGSAYIMAFYHHYPADANITFHITKETDPAKMQFFVMKNRS